MTMLPCCTEISDVNVFHGEPGFTGAELAIHRELSILNPGHEKRNTMNPTPTLTPEPGSLALNPEHLTLNP